MFLHLLSPFIVALSLMTAAAHAAPAAPSAVTDLRFERSGAATGVAATLKWTHSDASIVNYEVWRVSSALAPLTDPSAVKLADVAAPGVGATVSYVDPASSLNNIFVDSAYFVRGATASGAFGPESNRAGEFDFKLGEVTYRARGFGFSPFMDGQAPGATISEDQLRRRLGRIALQTEWVRTFGMGDGLDRAGAVAREMGLKTALGAWAGPDKAANEAEVAALIARAQAGEADIAVIGGEALYRGDVTPSELIGYLNEVRAAVPANVKVTTNEIWDVLIQYPDVIAACDLLLVNYYPYWLGIPLDKALAATDDWYGRTVAAAQGKPVWVGESGWPSCGDGVYRAVPSGPNAASHFLNFVSWAEAKGVPYFYFEAFAEGWKADGGLPQEACFGVWDAAGNQLTGMQSVFDGQKIADNWTGGPEIDLIYVPPKGSTANLIGQTWHADPSGHKVAVYIKVDGLWWTKPTFDQPLTTVQMNGRWECDITTGGNDAQATDIASYLLPNGYTPPNVEGWSALPSELEMRALAQVTVTR